MKYSHVILIFVCPFIFCQAALSADFQNLDFEATSLQPDGSRGFQPIEVALPGWTAYLGDNVQPNILYNDLFLGTAFVGLSGTIFPVFNGDFSVLLKPGASPFTTLPVSASLAQVGLIPFNAGILQFRATIDTFNPTIRDFFGVYVDGQRLQIFPTIEQTGPVTATFTADVSAYAGREVDLRFTSFNLGAAGPNALILDDISFIPVPEPSTLGLFALGGLLLGFSRWRSSLRK